MEVKLGPLEKIIKRVDISWDEVLQKNRRIQPFWPHKGWRKLEEMKVEPINEKQRECKPNCLLHVARMKNNSLPKNNAELKTKWTKTTWKTFEKIIRWLRKRLHSWRLIVIMKMLTPKVKVGSSESAVTRGGACHHYKNKLPELWYGRLNCAEMKRAGRKWILVSIVFRQGVVGTHSINLTLFELQGLYRHIGLHADSTVSDGGNINNYCAYNAR